MDAKAIGAEEVSIVRRPLQHRHAVHNDPRRPAAFTFGWPVSSEENLTTEFKEISGQHVVKTILNTAEEYAVAFLNSGGGSIFWGIRDADRIVVGVRLSVEQRDRLRRELHNKLHAIQPPLDPTRFFLEIHPVTGADSPSDAFVVELRVPAGDASEPYYTGGSQVYVRLNGANKKLNGQELTEWIKTRLATPPLQSVVHEPKLIELAGRIRRIFRAHGLEYTHLPSFVAKHRAPFQITLNDLRDDGALLSWLDERKLAWIAATFLVRRAWIDGEDQRIHEEHVFDRRPQILLSTLDQHLTTSNWEEAGAMPEAYFLRWGEGWRWRYKARFNVAFVMAIPLARPSNERIVFRYVCDFTRYPWDYARVHVQLRAWEQLLLSRANILTRCWELPWALGESLEANTHFWGEVLERPGAVVRTVWHPDDYGFSKGKGTDSGDASSHIDEYLRRNGLL